MMTKTDRKKNMKHALWFHFIRFFQGMKTKQNTTENKVNDHSVHVIRIQHKKPAPGVEKGLMEFYLTKTR
jgi:hypothetical protein